MYGVVVKVLGWVLSGDSGTFLRLRFDIRGRMEERLFEGVGLGWGSIVCCCDREIKKVIER